MAFFDQDRCYLFGYSAGTVHRDKIKGQRVTTRLLEDLGRYYLPIEFVEPPVILWGAEIRGISFKQVAVLGRYDSSATKSIPQACGMRLPYSAAATSRNEEIKYLLSDVFLACSTIKLALRKGCLAENLKLCKDSDPNGLFQLLMSANNTPKRIEELLKSRLGINMKLTEHGALEIN
jgi:hypothetical protein